MTENYFSDLKLVATKNEYSLNDLIEIALSCSIKGEIRDSFTEENWTEAYSKNDVSFKMKYGIKLTSGGFRKKEIGKAIDSYRKASIFWTRNPKLVNPHKDKRVWVQVAKNFEPFIRLSEEEVRQELFDFNEKFIFKAAELGKGKHKIGSELFASWQKHEYTLPGTIKGSADEIEVSIN